MSNLKQLALNLEKRCKAKNIGFQLDEDDFETEYYSLEFVSGGDKRYIFLQDEDEIQELLSIAFEKYVFINRYEAIWSYDDQSIESLIRSLDKTTLPIWYTRLLNTNPLRQPFDPYKKSIKIVHMQHSDIVIEIGASTKELEILTDKSNQRLPPLSLKLKGFKIKNHDQAQAILEKVAGSIFFEIELSLGMPFGLMLHEDLNDNVVFRKKRGRLQIDFPDREFDKEALALYWYARTAYGMPLLKFLAFYQVLEFYFPRYSQSQACKRIKNVLKDPTFNIENDSCLVKIFSVIRSNPSGYTNEKRQLKDTLKECIEEDDLRTFLTKDEDIKKFFTSKAKGLTDILLNVKNTEIFSSVADRIYDIRCKIVHTKNQERDIDKETRPLLPFSKESSMLNYDIQLLEYLAQKVIIAGSSSFLI